MLKKGPAKKVTLYLNEDTRALLALVDTSLIAVSRVQMRRIERAS